jgi:hypothetical protein
LRLRERLEIRDLADGVAAGVTAQRYGFLLTG